MHFRSYTATATFAGNANHTGSSGHQDYSINPAGSTTTVVCANAPFTYSGSPQGCSASWASTGSDAEGAVLSTITYTGRNGTVYSSTTAPSNAGDYTATATFAGNANHTGSSGQDRKSVV